MRPSSFRGSIVRVLALIAVLSAGVTLWAQIPGSNVNMVAGTDWPGGDPFLQRQNEPSIAASTRNPLHLVAGSNDYRTVDLPGLPGDDDPLTDVQNGDAWVSVYKSFDGGQRWSSTLLPGYPQDRSVPASPLKGYQAAADPVVRAGTNGLVYYSGLVFDRGENGRSGIFLARFIDQNNREDVDSVAYLGTSMVTTSPDGATFLDKPWMAVDIPRGNGGLCVVGGEATGTRVKRNGHRGGRPGNGPPVWVDPGLQYVQAGAVYVAYTAIIGEGSALQSQIFVKRSMDCGATWSQAMRVSQVSDRINQGATLAISPQTGDLFVAWRRFAVPTAIDGDAIMVSRLRVNGGSFDAPGKARGLRRTGPVAEALDRIFEHRKKRAQQPVTATTANQIDQGTSKVSFRTNVYPTMAIDGTGRAYVAWSERGLASAPDRQDPTTGDARILVATTTDARTISAPVIVDDRITPAGPPGHQLMPSLAIAGGKLLLVFYDQRETREPLGIGKFILDGKDPDTNYVPQKRQTIDIRASLGTLGATPSFAPSVRVSDYLVGYRSSSSSLEQLQFNPPNLPMFKLGTVPFIGDYIDVAPSPAFVPTAGGGWVYNTAPGPEMPVFHAVWTDNRDVRPPRPGSTWADYRPPTINGQTTSLFLDDGTMALQCSDGNAGSRNQNVYTARIGGALLVGSPGNSKQLSPTLQRGFVVFAQNQSTEPRTFEMRVVAQPSGGRASFKQLLPPNTPSSEPPLVAIVVGVPPRSTASRTLYVTSSDPRAQVSVNVAEIPTQGVDLLNLTSRVVLNPDIENPDIENPDIENSEIYNPDIENPDIENPDIENQGIENPDIENPDIENIVVGNPDIENLTVGNPDIENPDIENPDIENPDIENPDIENGAISDVTWTVSNTGNTTSAFNVNLFLASASLPPACNEEGADPNTCVNTQLIIYKTYQTPVIGPRINGVRDFCTVGTETRNVLIANIPSPLFIRPVAGAGVLDQNASTPKNATLWLAPGELGRITLRIYDRDPNDNVIITKEDGTQVSIDKRFDPRTKVTPGVSAQAVDQGLLSQETGATEPPIVTPNGTNMDYLWQPETAAVGEFLGTTVELNEVRTFFPVSVRVWLNSGAPATGVDVTMKLLTTAGTEVATLGVATTDLVNGIATFGNLSVGVAGTYRLLASATPAAGATASGLSNVFSVGPHVVSFVQQPSAANRGAVITPAVSVRLRDAAGVALPNAPLSLTLLTAVGGTVPAGVTLGGVTTATTTATGVATFTNLSVNQAGTYMLRATETSPGAGASSTSASFDVVLTVTPSFLQQPSAANVGASIAPAVRVRVIDGTGASLPGVQVSLALLTSAGAPVGAAVTLSGTTSQLTNADGTAVFANLSVNQTGTYVLRATATAPGAVGVIDSAPFNVAAAVTAWTATGDGVVTLVNNGATGTPAFSYAHNGDGVPSTPPAVDGPYVGAWALSTVAAAGGAVNLTYSWSGLHSYFQVTTGLDVFVNRGGVDVYLQPLVNEGPYVCCVTPSNGFGYSGATAVNVQAGDTYGFRLRGTHGDVSEQLLGTFNVTVGGTPLFAVNVLGAAGGALLDQFLAPRPTRVFAGTLTAGQHVIVTATGLINRGGEVPDNGPNGDGIPCPTDCLVPGVSQLALVARVNTGGTGAWQFVGAGPRVIVAPSAGFLEFGVNDNAFTDNTGAFVATVAWAAPASPGVTINSVTPSTGAPGQGFLVVRGTGLPAVSGSAAVVSNGASTAGGFVFLSPSTPSAYFVRLPSGFPTGAATLRIQNGATSSNAFPIAVSDTPGTPVITNVFTTGFSSTTSVSSGSTIYVSADGIDTTGVTVRFEQSASVQEVGVGSTSSGSAIGVASQVVVPGLTPGTVNVSIRQGGGAFSAPVTLTVVPVSF